MRIMVQVVPRAGHRPAFDPDRRALAPEIRPVSEPMPRLGLPLVHHLVKQRLRYAGPAVGVEVTAAQRDLGALARLGGPEFAQPPPHPRREPDLHPPEPPAEAARVELGVERVEPFQRPLVPGKQAARGAVPAPARPREAGGGGGGAGAPPERRGRGPEMRSPPPGPPAGRPAGP